ncbi:hypothetical protein [Agrobacterium fabrum]|uniref:hypothetical protein n=1 Tax=Agrobacterium fabrum TaxID=1176649 RepID=UPI003B9DFEDF
MMKKNTRIILFTLSFSLPLAISAIGASAQDTTVSAYLERRNDQGIVAFCSSKGLLEADSGQFFKVGTDEIFGDVENTPEANLHEQKGRDGISYLQGDEQSLTDLAAANGVGLEDVCGQYKGQIVLGRMMAKNRAAR